MDKSPRGPLTDDEIRSLMAAGILRANDPAYLLPSDPDSKAPTEWKMIWQFPEFNRRQRPEVSDKTTPPPAPERRANAEATPRQNVEAQVPIELLNIAPEDLLPRSTAVTAASTERKDIPDVAPVTQRPEFSLPSLRSAGFAVVGLVLALISAWSFFSTPSNNPVAAKASPSSTSATAPSSRRAVARRPPPPPSAPAARVEAPSSSSRSVAEEPEPLEEEEVAAEEEDQESEVAETRKPAQDAGNPRDTRLSKRRGRPAAMAEEPEEEPAPEEEAPADPPAEDAPAEDAPPADEGEIEE